MDVGLHSPKLTSGSEIFQLGNFVHSFAFAEGKRVVWLKLPRELSALVPIAVKENMDLLLNIRIYLFLQEGFEYHHAERGYMMLTYWIPEGSCLLPANASHQVGVAGFVINDKNEIDTEFVEVIAFRHAHNVAFQKSDLFFVCMLRPLSSQIKVDVVEIQAGEGKYTSPARWMPMAEFVVQPLIQEDSKFKKVIDICIARLGRRYCGLHPRQLVSKFDGSLSPLYYNITES
ncbi:hypothetical protein RJ641_035289 [Dillenia turbinata]|uniref:Uncharacterized protein n=1 Tax=Dillenia turbinata TaxID=194707 RepID=A0AAN8VNS5_9MAGN